MAEEATRLFIKIKREMLPRISDRYPFLYLERGRLEIDDSSIKWIDFEGEVIRIPVAVINTLLLGPGTSITHEAVKVASDANCTVCWVGEDSLLFYAAGIEPTADTKNLRRQAWLSSDEKLSEAVARALYAKRFPDAELKGKSINEMRGMEGDRVRKLYASMAEKYSVGWKGRDYTPGKFELSDMTNKILTGCNTALYGILCSCVHSLGYSPHFGFTHTGCPLPFIYDLADLYKADLCIDMAFAMTLKMAGTYNKCKVIEEFRNRVIKMDLLNKCVNDIESLLGEKSARRYSK